MARPEAALALALKRLIRNELTSQLKDLRSTVGRLERALARTRAAARPPARRPRGSAGRTATASADRMPAKEVRALRKRLAMSRAEFARTVGVTHVAVYFWESGRTTPAGPRLARLRALQAEGRPGRRRVARS